MPVVNVHRYSPSASLNGTVVVEGTLDISAGIIFEMNNPPYTSTGTWTLFTFGTLVGTVGNITLANNTAFTPSNLRVSGNSILVDLA